ncbi:hypothetical protein BARRETLEMON_56 [Arthrobacter phage BarretLemon]|uniref:Uncharacterized protein n=2 Tax=Marthavirus barretlemon TaxID=2560300 RepID=A0A386KQN2_9CAUD|nr:HTH DNA binding protein [Arthrobacter phage BarretLemon]AMM44518.1 hypothetical protein BARRETLEMON_56 [Arthrobacter phage BarretLemon]AYD86527.1 hypothetical protein SEA_LEEROYJ_56 [Arthrobacter phage LeeroyJ]
MKLTIKRKLTKFDDIDEQVPLPLDEALQMFYDGELIELAQKINDEELKLRSLEPMPFATIELEQTTKGDTLLVIRTDAIKTSKDDEL